MGLDQPLISRTLGGRFKITGHIGEGAMASVFRGVDVSRPDGGEVAIKVMHPHLAADRTFTARFKREAQAASMVKHANSVAILDVGEEQGIHYIIMELCAGKDLRDTLKLERRLPDVRAVRIVMSICQALGAAHQLGVVHRDLKPENVMVLFDPRSGTDQVKVLDFGIAKLVDAQPKIRATGSDSEPPAALTQMGVVIGTPQYMSPEQCRGQPIDGRSDLYTCGILLYQLTTGVLPFNSDSPVEVAGKQAFEQPAPPTVHLPTLDAALEGIILRCLAKTPAERPQSAADLHSELSQWLIQKSGPAPAVMPQTLRDLHRTMPLNAQATSVADYLRAQAIAQGTAQPLGPPANAPRPPLDTAIDPGAFQDVPPLPAGSAGLMPAESQPITHASPIGPSPQTPSWNTMSQEHAQEAEPRRGWGGFGFLMILLSLGAGVGIGFLLYRYVPL